MKEIFGLALFLSATLSIMSCNSGEATNQAQKVSPTTNNKNNYSCPMHPDVTGKKGEKCPKCGMALVQSNTGSSTKTYYIQLASTPARIMPNKELTLSLTPKNKDAQNELVGLETSHEKKIHLILVSDDLSWFNHVHPEAQTDGSYSVKATFPAAGRYLAFADYKPIGGEHVVDKIELQVEGDTPPVQNYTTDKLSGSSGKYSFSVTPKGGQFLAGESRQMEGVIKKEGKVIDVNTLTDYLGAKAHIVVIGLSDKDYLHIHPEVVNGKFNIHTTFNKPGIYRGWIQFNGDDQLHTVDFTINLKQVSATNSQKANADLGTTANREHHSEHHH